jgi:hypothetical protein
LISNKVTSRSYSYFLKVSYFYFLRNWFFQLCQKLQSLVKKTQGILGVNIEIRISPSHSHYDGFNLHTIYKNITYQFLFFTSIHCSTIHIVIGCTEHSGTQVCYTFDNFSLIYYFNQVATMLNWITFVCIVLHEIKMIFSHDKLLDETIIIFPIILITTMY